MAVAEYLARQAFIVAREGAVQVSKPFRVPEVAAAGGVGDGLTGGVGVGVGVGLTGGVGGGEGHQPTSPGGRLGVGVGCGAAFDGLLAGVVDLGCCAGAVGSAAAPA
jgi:hypothetical protein